MQPTERKGSSQKSGDTEQQSADDPEVVRINLSLSKRTREKFEKLANEHYSGNTSGLIRAAVHDHEQTTLQGEGQVTLELIKSELASNEEVLDEILEALRAIQDDRETVSDGSSGRDDNQHANTVLQFLIGTKTPVSHSKLLRELDLTPVNVRDAVGALLDMGAIEVYEQKGESQYSPKAITGGNN